MRAGSPRGVAAAATAPAHPARADELSGRALLLLFLAFLAADACLTPVFLSSSDAAPRRDDAPSSPATASATSFRRDVAVFGTALFTAATTLSVVSALWATHPARRRHFWSATYVNAVAGVAHLQMMRGGEWWLVGDARTRGDLPSGLRLLSWFFSTPVMIVLMRQFHGLARKPPLSSLTTVSKSAFKGGKKGGNRAAADGGGAAKAKTRASSSSYAPPPASHLAWGTVFMLACGCGGVIAPGMPPPIARVLVVLGGGAFAWVLTQMVRILLGAAEGSAFDSVRRDRGRIRVLVFINVCAWCVFPLVFLARRAGLIDDDEAHLGFSAGDGCAKFSLSALYLVGCGRIFDLAEEDVRRRVQEGMADQLAFYHSLSFELRQPLSAVIGFGQLALEYPGPEKVPSAVRDFQRAILASAESMRSLVVQASEYSRLEAEIRNLGILKRPAIDRDENAEGDGEVMGFSPATLLDDVMTSATTALTLGVEVVVETRPKTLLRAAPSTAKTTFVGNVDALRDCLVTLTQGACACRESKEGDCGGAVRCVKLLMELGDATSDEDHFHGATYSEATFTAFVPVDGVPSSSSKGPGASAPSSSSPSSPSSSRRVVSCRHLDEMGMDAAKNKMLGLSMTVARAVVEAMGGDLSYALHPEDASEPDCFSISVPLRRVLYTGPHTTASAW